MTELVRRIPTYRLQTQVPREPHFLRSGLARARDELARRRKSRGPSEESSTRAEAGDASESRSEWRVDWAASREHLRDFDPTPDGTSGGALVYTDEHGAQRVLPADRGELSARDIAAAARATADELGAVDSSYAQVAALERLNEMRSAGAVSEENYLREKRRILGLD